MDFISRVLFESRLWLGIFSFLLFAVVLLARPRCDSQAARKYALPATLLLILLLFALQSLVVTQREQVLQALDRFVAAFERKDMVTIAELIDEDYQSEDMDRALFLQYLASFLDVWDVRDVRFRRRDVDVLDEAAQMVLAAGATASYRKRVGQFHWGAWRIGWARGLSGWRITSIRPEMIDGHSLTSLHAVRGAAQ